jgi:hypothetical protein
VSRLWVGSEVYAGYAVLFTVYCQGQRPRSDGLPLRYIGLVSPGDARKAGDLRYSVEVWELRQQVGHCDRRVVAAGLILKFSTTLPLAGSDGITAEITANLTEPSGQRFLTSACVWMPACR